MRFLGIDAVGLITSVQGAYVRLSTGDGRVVTRLTNVVGRPLVSKNDYILVLEDPVVRMPAYLSVRQWSNMKNGQKIKLSDKMILPQQCLVAKNGKLLFFLDGGGRFGAVDVSSVFPTSP